ncbi:MAG: hypothetical protein R8K53_03050 [Mariprofundaceae bacterium]
MNKIKTSIAAAVIAMVGLSSPAFAGGVQLDNKSLTDVLVQKGVLTKADAKAIKHNNEGKLKLGAKFFFNSTRTDKTVQTVTPVTDKTTKTTGLNIDRAYLTAKYYFNNNWMARITTDSNSETSVKGNNIFLKYAYVEGKLFGEAAVLRLGQSHTPWIDYQQHQNKHRFVFKTFVDTYGFDTSSDLGIGLKGKLFNGMVDYWVTETDGQGYGSGNTPSGNNSLDFDSRLSLHPIKDLSLDFQFRDGFKATKKFVNNVTTAGIKSTLYQIQIAYMPHGYGVGIGYLNSKDSAKGADGLKVKHGSSYTLTTATGGVKDLKSDGFYIWGRSNLGNGFGVFGTYERLKNKRQKILLTTEADEKITRFVLGAEYSPVKHVTFAAVIDQQSFKSTAGVLNDKTDQTKVGIYSQVKF